MSDQTRPKRTSKPPVIFEGGATTTRTAKPTPKVGAMRSQPVAAKKPVKTAKIDATDATSRTTAPKTIVKATKAASVSLNVDSDSSIDNESETIDSDGTDGRESPPSSRRIPPTPCGIHLFRNGRKASSVDSRNVDLNVPYKKFLEELFSGLKEPPFRLKEAFLQNADATITWLWLTTRKDQCKSLPTLNALSREEHYEAIRDNVMETTAKSKKLSNVILRIHIELKERIGDNDDESNGTESFSEEAPYARPSATTRQRQELAGLPRTSLNVCHQRLLNHLICETHHKTDEWCWKPQEPPFSGKKCIPLNASDLLEWAAAMKDGVATVFAPPDRQTFWSKKEKLLKSRPRRKSDESHPYHSPIVIQLNDKPHPNTPQKPRALSFTVSPVRGFAPQHYHSDGLAAYLNFLHDLFSDETFLDLYYVLNENRLGIDLFKSSTASVEGIKELVKELKEDCRIPIGTARRLAENFKTWQKTFQQEAI